MSVLTQIPNCAIFALHGKKSRVGFHTPSNTRRSITAPFLRGFSMVGRSGPRKRAVPCSGSVNPVRPTARASHLCGWVKTQYTEGRTMRVSVFCLFPIDVACLWLGALRGLRAHQCCSTAFLTETLIFGGQS